MSEATSTLNTNDTTNTFESKIRSRYARSPPNTASSAATTAIGRYGCMASGTPGWNTRPNTMPMTSAAIPIIDVRSLGPNPLGEVDISNRTGGQGQAFAGADAHSHPVRGLQQPQALQAGTAVKHVRHGVRRSDRENDIGAADRLIVDQDAAARLPDRHVRADSHTAHRDRLGTAYPQGIDHQLQVAVQDDLPARDALLGHVAEVLGHPGVGDGHGQARADHRGDRRREVGAIEAGQQLLAAFVAGESAAAL